ncbi:Acid stress protein IbaG [Candidatus Profftia lariciata]|uniref:BolA family protein n=1 Tax=Candidatus Profftia lariciata TaxID=1987921 RepID=UPI001D014D7A|nr:BolA family protein [Candidatus Profftia lariciata]UDG81490.1 Acid stress protein IbaG [Candidatus Profftia lariciata]
MTNNEIKDILMHALFLQEVYVTLQSNHVHIIAIDKRFFGISPVKQQQIIYAPLMQYIADKSIHALSIKVFTPQEWQTYCKLNKL